MRPAAVLLALIALAGCSSEDERPDPLQSYNGRLIRDWLRAVEEGDFQHAADFFAPGAVIDQGRGPYRLKSRELAVGFNALLPCHADLVGLRGGGRARRVVATFRLRRGPGGECAGLVTVRYTIEDGRFTEWIQRPDSGPDSAPAQSAAAPPGAYRGGAVPPWLA